MHMKEKNKQLHSQFQGFGRLQTHKYSPVSVSVFLPVAGFRVLSEVRKSCLLPTICSKCMHEDLQKPRCDKLWDK